MLLMPKLYSKHHFYQIYFSHSWFLNRRLQIYFEKNLPNITVGLVFNVISCFVIQTENICFDLDSFYYCMQTAQDVFYFFFDKASPKFEEELGPLYPGNPSEF